MRLAQCITTVGRKFLIAGLIISAMIFCGGSVQAQAPQITCPGTVSLTLDDIGQDSIEVPVTGADAVTVSSGTWLNDTLYVTVSMPVTDTFRVIASNIDGADTCDVIVEFPGVTTKSGTVDEEVWTAAESPYCIVDDIYVGSLEIQPGCSVLFYGNFVFRVGGNMQAIGTEGDSIYFTVGGPTVGWQGVFFDLSTYGSHLMHCVVEYSDYSGIRITNSDPVIENCCIRGNYGRYGGGVWVTLDAETDLFPEIRNCDIKQNTSTTSGNACNGAGEGNGGGGGVWATTSTGSLLLHGCNIAGNSTGSGRGRRYGGGVYINGTAVVRLCVISGNYAYSYCCPCAPGACRVYSRGGGLYGQGTLTVENTIIKDNALQATACFTGSGIANGDGLYFVSGSLSLRNSVVANNTWSAKAVGTYLSNRGAAYFGDDAQVDIINSTIVDNQNHGINRLGGEVGVANSIVYGNYSGGTQIYGDVSTIAVSYSDIQDGYPGDSIIDVGPVLDPDSYQILSMSPCIDAGDPSQQYEDRCFPPSRGLSRNDIGAHGGPGACGWVTEDVWIACPDEVGVTICELGDEVCISFPIGSAQNVYTSGGAWSSQLFCFTPEDWGDHYFGVIAENGISADTCDFVVNVARSVPLETSTARVLFATTESALSQPDPKTVYISTPCDSGLLEWEAAVFGGDWLQIDKMSGTNPDSIALSIVDSTYTTGIYGAVVSLRNPTTEDPPVLVNVTLFVAAGTDVGTVVAKPGTAVAVPITISTDNYDTLDSVTGFTIPLQYESDQLDKVIFDSLKFDDPLFDNVTVYEPIEGLFIAERPTDEPPLPDSIYEAYAYFSIGATAEPEIVLIDTADYDDAGTIYTYEFVQNTGDTTVPSFSPGAIVIGYEPVLPTIDIDYDSLMINMVPPFDSCLYVGVENYETVEVMAVNGTQTYAEWHDDSLCFDPQAEGACTFDVTASNYWGSVTEQVVYLVTKVERQMHDNLPDRFEMGQNYPNPFNPVTTVKFALPEACEVTLEVFNIIGQKVTTLIDKKLNAGYYNVTWDSRSSSGNAVASGIYLYRIKAGENVATRKMLLLK